MYAWFFFYGFISIEKHHLFFSPLPKTSGSFILFEPSRCVVFFVFVFFYVQVTFMVIRFDHFFERTAKHDDLNDREV